MTAETSEINGSRLNHSGTMIVTPAESPDKYKHLKIIKAGRTVYKRIDMDPHGIGTGQLQGIGRLMITV